MQPGRTVSFLRRRLSAIIVVLSPVVFALSASGQTDTSGLPFTRAPVPPAPPTNVRARDTRHDQGHSLDVTWDLSADEGQGRKNILMYKIVRTPRLVGPIPVDSAPPGDPTVRVYSSAVYSVAAWRLLEGEWDTAGQVPSGTARFTNSGGKVRDANDFLPDFTDFRYRVVAVSVDGAQSASEPSAPAQSSGQWLHHERVGYIGLPVVAFTVLILVFINAAQKGKELYIRRLAGIDAVDEAIGRATEMNRPILYILGLGAADEIATIASCTILSRVAKRVAEHRTELIVPCYDAVVMTVAQETVRQAYLDAGRPDEYKEDIVHFVTQEQFAYVAAVNGTMLRRQTATNFYLGVFYAESLILAETGSLAGSIQIAGTDRTTQIPFFVVACDYTLIGEELYAASAYLSKEPKLLGTLKAQDWAKAIFIGALGIGAIGAALQWDGIVNLFRMHL